MANDQSKPTPRGKGKAAVVIAAVGVLLIIGIFVGLNMQHSKELGEEKAGQVQPRNQPLTEKDLGKAPVQQSK